MKVNSTETTPAPPAAEQPEEALFARNGLKLMAEGFNIRGFKRTYRTLYAVILKSMRDWADYQAKPLADQLEEERKKHAVLMATLHAIRKELTQPSTPPGSRILPADQDKVLQLINETLLLIK